MFRTCAEVMRNLYGFRTASYCRSNTLRGRAPTGSVPCSSDVHVALLGCTLLELMSYVYQLLATAHLLQIV